MEQHGNPVSHGIAGHENPAGHVTGGVGEHVDAGHAPVGGAAGHQQHHGGAAATGVLQRSGSSSSSSSSEDDGMGGRRKKGIKEKVKEKLPGGHKKEDAPLQHGGVGAAAAPPGEKKGIVEKIKEKLPGSHN